MMEYEEIRDRLETLREQLEFVANSLSKSESRLHQTIERTDTVQLSARILTHKFEEIARDLTQAEQGLKNTLAKARKTDEQEFCQETLKDSENQ